jgi:hypothetical protein
VAEIFVADPVEKVAEPKPRTGIERLFDMVAVVRPTGRSRASSVTRSAGPSR